MNESTAKVRVYYNLTRKVWSIQHHVPGKGWRLLTHSIDVILRNANCKVYESGRQRVIRERKKYVHAYIEGELIGIYPREHTRLKLTYNPYRAGHFSWSDSPQPVDYCGTVVFNKEGVFAAF